jgi:predicted PurR-regulated permease PerM
VGILVFVVIVVALDLARDVLIPFALAVLLSFMLRPVVSRLQGIGIHRVPSVLVVVALALALAGLGGWLVAGQILGLADKLPEYQSTVHTKLKALHTRPGSPLGKLNQTLESYSGELQSITSQPATEKSDTPATLNGTTQAPVPVTIAKQQPSSLELLQALALKALGPIVSVGIVIVLTLFMLMQWEDVRDRAIRLIGPDQLHVATTAMDDASRRVGRYLLSQLTVNSMFGVCCGTGLYFIGVPYGALWGVVAACARFIPYFGAPAAALFPLIMAFAAKPGFSAMWWTAGLYAGLELSISNFVEPWLYGSSTGISPLAILGSAMFWSFLWGPLGLLLSTPLTVCVVVMGKHVPKLYWLNVIFGDEPALAPEARFYQRLLAADQEEAAEMAEEQIKKTSIVELYDSLMIPALILAEQDRHRGDLEESQKEFVFQGMRDLVEDISTREESKLKDANPTNNAGLKYPPESDTQSGSVLCIPAKDPADEIAANMLAGLLRGQGLSVQVTPGQMLTAERVDLVETLKPCVVCVSAVPPLALLHARYLCARLRARYPDLKLVVGVWQSKSDSETLRNKLPTSLVEHVAVTLADAAARITAISSFQCVRSATSLST